MVVIGTSVVVQLFRREQRQTAERKGKNESQIVKVIVIIEVINFNFSVVSDVKGGSL